MLDWASRIQSGDRAAEAELVQYFGKRVYALLCARTRDTEASRDLQQEVLMAVITALRQGQVRDPDKLPAFVLSVARNKALTHFRDRSREDAAIPLDENIAVRAEEDALVVAERRSLVRKALTTLDSTDREILLRTLLRGEKPGVIAHALGLSPDATRQRKSRAVKKVAEFVKACHESAAPAT